MPPVGNGRVTTPTEQLPDRVAALLGRLRNAEKELEQLRAGQIQQWAGQFAATAQDIDGLAVVARHLPEPASTGPGEKQHAVWSDSPDLLRV